MAAIEPKAWVVFRMGVRGAAGRSAVCTQDEWDEMESTRPGFNVLIREQIGNEGEAERLARTTPSLPEPALIRSPVAAK